MLKFGLYSRKSDDDRRVTEKSIGEQVAECRRVQEIHSLAVERVWEESRSAQVPDNRPLWGELIKDVKAGRIDAILCWHINRLVRNMKEGGELVQLFVDGKIKEIRTPHSVHRTGDNILPLVIEAAAAAQFSIDLKHTVRRSMDAKSAAGGFNGMAPQGYLNARDPSNGKRGTVVRDPARFDLMRKGWELMLTGGYTVQRVTDTLNDAWGYRTRPTPLGGNRPLSMNGLYQTFRNPFYAGFVLSGGQIVRGTHEPMVTADEFHRVQGIMGRRTFRARRGASHAFTGLMACGYCGQQVTAERKRLSHGGLWDSYHCSDTYGRCTKKGMALAKVEASVAAGLAAIRLDSETADIALEEVLLVLNGGERDVSALLAAQQASRTEAKARLDKLTEMWMSGMLTDRSRYADLESKELATLNDLAEGIERNRSELERMRANAKRARDFAVFSKERFLLAEEDEKRAIAKALGTKYSFFGREKTIQIESEPLLLEFVSFATSNPVPFEPRRIRSHKQKQTSREETLVYGGPACDENELPATWAAIRKAKRLPERLVEALRGPLFPDLRLTATDGDWVA